jgi:hypothetical protein
MPGIPRSVADDVLKPGAAARYALRILSVLAIPLDFDRARIKHRHSPAAGRAIGSGRKPNI